MSILLPNYCLIAISDISLKKELESLAINTDLTFVAYGNPDVWIGIYECPRHFEPLIRLASQLRERNPSLKLFSGAELLLGVSRRSQLPKTSINLCIYAHDSVEIEDTGDFTRNTARTLLEIYGKVPHLLAFRLIGNKIALIYPTDQWRDVDDCLKGQKEFPVVKRVLGLSPESFYSPPEIAKGAKPPYDPLKGRFAELKNWQDNDVNITRHIKSTLEAKTVPKHYEEMVANYLLNLQDSLDGVKRRISQIEDDSRRAVPDWNSMVNVEKQLHLADRRLWTIKEFVDQRMTLERRRSRLQEPLSPIEDFRKLMNCTDNVIADISSSLGFRRPIFPVFVHSSSFSIDLNAHSHDVYFVNVPLRFMHRLGLLPLLAEPIAHALIIRSNEIYPEFYSMIHQRAEQFTSEIKGYVRDRGIESVNEESVTEQNIMDYWMATQGQLLADIISLLVMGPAYLYALYRAGRWTSQAMIWSRLYTLTLLLDKTGITNRMTISRELQNTTLNVDHAQSIRLEELAD
jgi:hypothetical protein